MKKVAIGIALVLLGVLLNSGIAQSKTIESTITMERQQTVTLSAAIAAVVTAVVGAVGGVIAAILGGGGITAAVVAALGTIGGALATLATAILSALGLGGIAATVAAAITGLFGLLATAVTTIVGAAGALLGAIAATQIGSIILQLIVAALDVIIALSALIVIGGGTIVVDLLLLLILNVLSIPFYCLLIVTMPIGCIAWPILFGIDGRIGVLKDILLSPLSIIVFPLFSSLEHPIELVLELIVGNVKNLLALPGGLTGSLAGLIGGGLEILNSLVLSVIFMIVAGSGILFTGGMIRTAAFEIEKIVVDIIPDAVQKGANVFTDTLASLIPGLGALIISFRDNFLDPTLDAIQGVLETIVNVFSGTFFQAFEELNKLYGLSAQAAILGGIAFLAILFICLGGICAGLSFLIIPIPLSLPLLFIFFAIGIILAIIGITGSALLHNEAVL